MRMISIGRGIAVSSALVLLGACGSKSTASDTTNTAVVAAAIGSSAAATATTNSPVITRLPPAALSAWEGYARGQCREEDLRFAAVRFAPLTGSGEAADLVQRRFAAGTGGFLSGDFNADGQPDFVVTTPNHGCVDDGPAYGDQGAPVDFIVSSANGYRVFDGFTGWIAPTMIAHRDGRAVLDLDAGVNGRCGAVAKVTWGWANNRIDAVERRNARGQLVDREGCAVGAQANTVTATPTGNFPPIPQGIYAVETTCAAAIAAGSRTSPSDSLAAFSPASWGRSWDGMGDGSWASSGRVQRVEPLGNNQFRIRTSQSNTITIAVTGAASFTETTFDGARSGTRYTHCPDATVPAWVKTQFLGGGR